VIAAYAPIVGEGGENYGLMGVDMDGRCLYSHARRSFTAMAAASQAIICLAFVCLLRFSDYMLDSVLKDKLTGAFAKRRFEGLLNEGIRNSAQRGRGMALMMIDLDHFKRVNDTYGHAFGDEVLVTVSKTIRDSIKSDDYFVRYGGEEFAVMMAYQNPGVPASAAERLRRAVSGTPIFCAEGTPMRMTVSIGVALHGAGQSARELPERADRALYEAKTVRNTVIAVCLNISVIGRSIVVAAGGSA
jgi:diguanylate cyclase (GGDEF)-like protein